MRRNFQIRLTISLMVIFQLGFWSFTFLSQRYIKNELIKQIIDDNKVMGEQMVSLLKNTGLTSENPETDSIIQNICEIVKLPNGGFICAINKMGNLVAAPGLKPGMSMPFGASLQDLNFKNTNILAKNLPIDMHFTGYAYFSDEKRLDLIASMPIGENLRLFVHQNSAFVQQKAWNSVKPLILFGIMVTAIAGAFTYLTTKKIVISYESKIELQNKELKVAFAQIKEKQEIIVGQNTVLTQKSDELMISYQKISNQNKDINDSIRYAERIQHATLPKPNIKNEIINDCFLFFQPKNVVSGDFYWYYDIGNLFYIAAVDCTGHGVPGAFMSLLGITFLNEIVVEKKIKDPGIILEYMRRSIINALGQKFGKGTTFDGMDMVLCVMDKSTYKMEFAGAYNRVICMRGTEIIELEGDRMPVGIHPKMEEEFTNKTLELRSNDVLYMFSDGFADQFGGKQGRKFMTKNFYKLLSEIKGFELSEQQNILEHTHVEWKGNFEQVDDILIIGLKIK